MEQRGVYDAIIIGGGFFGARIAVFLAAEGKTVLLLERDADLMQRASYVNQARVHGGYHYPRSLLTALRSRVNLPIFAEEYSDCIDRSFDQYYAIGRELSKVSAQQFLLFSQRIQAPIRRAPENIRKMFNSNLIEDVFAVEEYAFDSTKIKQRLLGQLKAAGVVWQTEADALRVSKAQQGIVVDYLMNQQEHRAVGKAVYNCTYSRINKLNRSSNLPLIRLKHEIAEIALIEPPDELREMGVTVMCGPFFSTMPFPSRGLHSFTHVRYTPHTEWSEGDGEEPTDSYRYLSELRLTSAYPKMLADAKRYLPLMSESRHVESLYEVKTVLPQSEGDDSRPILFRENHGLEGYTCIMGGKLDNIYDVFKELPE